MTNKNATVRLAEEYDDVVLQMGFLAAEKFHVHFFHGNLEDYELDADRPMARLYVQRMVALVEGYKSDGGS